MSARNPPDSETARVNRLFAAFAVVALTGCPKPPAAAPVAEPAAPPAVVRVSAPPGAATRLVERYGKAWARSRGLSLELVAPAATADLRLFAPTELGRLAPQLRPLPDALTAGPNWNGILRLYRTRLLDWGGQKFALPLLGSARLLAYRADRFRAAGLAAPATWAEFDAVAARLPQPSLPPLADDDESLLRAFLETAAPLVVRGVTEDRLRDRAANDLDSRTMFAFEFDPETAEPRLNHPGFRGALDSLRNRAPHRAPKADALADGTASMGVVDLAGLAALNARANPGRWAVARVPGGPDGNFVPYIGGGIFAAVSRAAARPADAEQLLAHLSGPTLSLDVLHDPSFGGGPFRDEHLTARREGWFNYGLDEKQTTRLLDVLQAAADPAVVNPALPLRVPEAAEYRAALAAAIRAGLTGDAAAALAGAEAKWRTIAGGKSVAERRADYRRSLGLQ